MWLVFAFGSALFAGLTSILAKMWNKENRFRCCNWYSNYYSFVVFLVNGVYSWFTESDKCHRR